MSSMLTETFNNESKYKLIVESAIDYAIFTVDKKNRINTWNTGAENVLGFSEKEILGRNGSLLFTPADRKKKAPAEEMATALHTGRAEDERWHLRKDGSRFWAMGVMMPLKDSSGKVLGFLKILRDMTALKEAEAAQQRFKMLVENIKDYAIMFLDSKGIITEWNDGAARLKGYSAEEVVGRHFRIFYTRDDQKKRQPEHELELAVKSGRSEAEGWRVRKDGSRFWVNEIVTPIRHRSGKLVGFAKVSRDLTERREAEEALRMMNDSLERRVQERTAEMEDYQTRLRTLALQLSRTQESERQRIASDIHDNLAQILALCEMRLSVVRKHVSDPHALKSVTDISKYIDQAIKYTRSLMTDLSPPVLQKRELLPAIQWLAHDMQNHGLKVSVHHKQAGGEVSDEVFSIIVQGVRELLFNVLKHAHADRASVFVESTGRVVSIRVKDRGRGFDLKASRMNKHAFGLFTLRERLRLLRGQVEVKTAPGQGTEVTLNVPARAAIRAQRPTAAVIPPAAERRRSSAPIRVLIVDDQKMMRDGLKKIVEEESDIEIVGEAVDGAMGVLMARELKPDVVLMDVNMPRMDGIEATRRIVRGKKPPAVIGLSIHEDAQTEHDLRRAGASDYISKRGTADKLYASIRKWAGAKQKNLKRN